MSKDSHAIRNRSRLDAAVLRNCKFKRSNAQKHGVFARPVILPGEDLSSKVRGRPFQPGNPGRPPGSKNKTTRLVEQLVDNNAEKITQKFVQLALAGNVQCLRYCVDRLLPQRTGRPLDFQLPTINGAQDILTAMSAVASGLSSGNLTAEEASHLVHLLGSYERAIITSDLAVRLEKLELRMKKNAHDS